MADYRELVEFIVRNIVDNPDSVEVETRARHRAETVEIRLHPGDVGRVIGKSDEIGGYPAERPQTPANIVATIYHSLGIDLETELPGPQGRPFPLIDRGFDPIKELF